MARRDPEDPIRRTLDIVIVLLFFAGAFSYWKACGEQREDPAWMIASQQQSLERERAGQPG